MTLFFLAFIAGFLTILAPCILPILPVVLRSGSDGSWKRPILLTLGFITSFSLLGGFFATIGSTASTGSELLRQIAIYILLVFGLAFFFPEKTNKLFERIFAPMRQLGTSAAQKAQTVGGTLGMLLTGIALGLVWVPCAGPILGTIITLAITTQDFVTTAILFGSYAAGAGISLLTLSYVSGLVLSKLNQSHQWIRFVHQVFAAAIILFAVLMLLGYDQHIQTVLIQYYPNTLLPL